MTSKLAVLVFAMSITLVGCGSSSTTKPDAGVGDAKPAVPDVATAEAAKPVDTNPSTPDAGVDTALPHPDVAVDTATPDVSVADVGVDAGETGVSPDGGTLPDVAKPIDVATDLATVKLDARDVPSIDAPDAGDGAVLEAGSVDGGDAGSDGG